MDAETAGWELLARREPAAVSEGAACAWEPAEACFVLPSFGSEVRVWPGSRRMEAAGAATEWLLRKMGYFSRLAILRYLAGARNVPLTGRLVKTSEFKVTPTFFEGSHTLPLGDLAARYAADVEGFVARAGQFGGQRGSHGDASAVLFPLPRLPVTLILWRGDEEFSARSDLLFDSSCEQHVPADVLWSVAVICITRMLQ
jgi:hypothetical protein